MQDCDCPGIDTAGKEDAPRLCDFARRVQKFAAVNRIGSESAAELRRTFKKCDGPVIKIRAVRSRLIADHGKIAPAFDQKPCQRIMHCRRLVGGNRVVIQIIPVDQKLGDARLLKNPHSMQGIHGGTIPDHGGTGGGQFGEMQRDVFLINAFHRHRTLCRAEETLFHAIADVVFIIAGDEEFADSAVGGRHDKSPASAFPSELPLGGQHGNRAVNGAAREAVFAYKLVSGRNFCVYGQSPVFDFRHDFTAQRFDFSLHVFSPA